MKKIKLTCRIVVSLMTFFIIFDLMSNTSHASLGLMSIEADIMEKYSGNEFDQWGALYIPNDQSDIIWKKTVAEYNYMMGYYDKEVDSFLIGYEFEQAVDDFYASKGKSLDVLESESGWNESLMQKYMNASDFSDAPTKDGETARKNHDKLGNNVATTSSLQSNMNVTSYKGVDYSAEFNAQYYYDTYPDLQQAIGKDGVQLLEHYVNYGKAEGRKAIN